MVFHPTISQIVTDDGISICWKISIYLLMGKSPLIDGKVTINGLLSFFKLLNVGLKFGKSPF